MNRPTLFLLLVALLLVSSSPSTVHALGFSPFGFFRRQLQKMEEKKEEACADTDLPSDAAPVVAIPELVIMPTIHDRRTGWTTSAWKSQVV